MKSLDQKDAEAIFSLYPHILERLYKECDKRKVENALKTSFCSIKVLDNAHIVDKQTIQEIRAVDVSGNSQTRTSQSSTSEPPMGKEPAVSVGLIPEQKTYFGGGATGLHLLGAHAEGTFEAIISFR
jgi:hypothetical protein